MLWFSSSISPPPPPLLPGSLVGVTCVHMGATVAGLPPSSYILVFHMIFNIPWHLVSLRVRFDKDGWRLLKLSTLIKDLVLALCFHPASRAFLIFDEKEKEKSLSKTRYTASKRGYAEIVLSLYWVCAMCKPLLGDSFKSRSSRDRTPKCQIDFRTEGSILTFALSKIW